MTGAVRGGVHEDGRLDRLRGTQPVAKRAQPERLKPQPMTGAVRDGVPTHSASTSAIEGLRKHSTSGSCSRASLETQTMPSAMATSRHADMHAKLSQFAAFLRESKDNLNEARDGSAA